MGHCMPECRLVMGLLCRLAASWRYGAVCFDMSGFTSFLWVCVGISCLASWRRLFCLCSLCDLLVDKPRCARTGMAVRCVRRPPLPNVGGPPLCECPTFVASMFPGPLAQSHVVALFVGTGVKFVRLRHCLCRGEHLFARSAPLGQIQGHMVPHMGAKRP